MKTKQVKIGCEKCGNLVNCVCPLQEAHAEDCRFLIAASLSFELACDHGFQACEICDPCSCGVGSTGSLR